MLLVFLVQTPASLAYLTVVDALGVECFFEKVSGPGIVVGVPFEVIEGGFLDIDMELYGPDGEIVFSKERTSGEKLAVASTKEGNYTVCFSNKMSTITPKVIMFSINVAEKDKPIAQPGDYTSKEAEEIQPEKLEKMIKELRSVILGIKRDQSYMEARDRIHLTINESTNTRVVMWVVFEAVLAIVVTASQAFYIKRFFEVRRIV